VAELSVSEPHSVIGDRLEGLGTALLARVLPWWAAGFLHLVLGLAVLALVVSVILHGDVPVMPNVLLELTGVGVYILGAVSLALRIASGEHSPGGTIIGYCLVYIFVADVLGAPSPGELVNRLGEHVGW
jgi:hypothetical protein